MKKTDTVTCSFVLDRDIYNAYKSIITAHGESVKGNLVKYMKEVINYNTPNATTIQAIQEVEEMKKNPDAYKSYSNADEMMRDILDEIYN